MTEAWAGFLNRGSIIFGRVRDETVRRGVSFASPKGTRCWQNERPHISMPSVEETK